MKAKVKQRVETSPPTRTPNKESIPCEADNRLLLPMTQEREEVGKRESQTSSIQVEAIPTFKQTKAKDPQQSSAKSVLFCVVHSIYGIISYVFYGIKYLHALNSSTIAGYGGNISVELAGNREGRGRLETCERCNHGSFSRRGSVNGGNSRGRDDGGSHFLCLPTTHYSENTLKGFCLLACLYSYRTETTDIFETFSPILWS